MRMRALASQLHLRVFADVARGVELRGRIWLRGTGRVELGRNCVLDGSEAPIELHAGPGAILTLGEGVRVLGGTSIEAQSSVRLGAGVQVGRFCKIIDNHFHVARGDRRARPSSTPVEVGPDVVLEDRVILLPGAVIGESCQVRTGSVVSRRVPSGVVLCGVPAAVVSQVGSRAESR